MRTRCSRLAFVALPLLLGLAADTARAQPPSEPSTTTAEPTPTSTGDSDSGPSVGDSRVGYIDNAIPGNILRFRYDTAYNLRRPNRAEFFWARGAPLGPGVPFAESSVDYQDFLVYLETVAPSQRLSAFVELPARLVNPQINTDSGGFADMNAGLKYAFVRQPDLVATLQWRTYIPTGDADRGLGNDHVSLEPGLLTWGRLTDRLCLESELRYWIPIGGTDFAGDVIRYGVGAQYDLLQTRSFTFTPVLEFVGWTVINGAQTVVRPGGPAVFEDAAGDTILNAKLGMRVKVGQSGDFYFGYGRPLTGDRWYENVYRVEYRLFF